GDGILDSCQLGGDCNHNGILDAVEILANPALDLNADGVLDECQGTGDCNQNGIPDSLEIINNPLLDMNTDGLLDECQHTEEKYEAGDLHNAFPVTAVAQAGNSDPAKGADVEVGEHALIDFYYVSFES